MYNTHHGSERRTNRGDSSEGSGSVISMRQGDRDRRRMHTKSMIEIGGGGGNYGCERNFEEVPRRKNSTRSISRGGGGSRPLIRHTDLTDYE